MPNFVMNVVKFGASGEKMDEIKKAITDDKGNIDFNKIIPMPKELNVEAGSNEDRSIDCYKHGFSEISRRDMMDKYKIDEKEFWELYEKGKVYDSNKIKYGYPTWYEWCRANWGTKWNASETHWNSDNIVTFETAWACPIPIFERISEMYPDISFEIAFADEDIGYNCGMLFYSQGEGSEIDNFNEEEATEFAKSIWDGAFEFEGE